VLGSSLTALAVVRVGAREGLTCTLIDDRRGPAAPTALGRFILLSEPTLAALLESVDALRGHSDVAVVADSDRWLRFVAEHRGALAEEKWLVLHPTSEALRTCLDKTRFLDWCAQRRLPAPQTFDPVAIAQSHTLPFPLLLRPEETQHSRPTGLPKAHEVRNVAELVHWRRRYADAGVTPNVCESLLRPGLRQFSVGAARDAHGRTHTFLAEKLRPAAEACAGGTYVVPVLYVGIEALAERALESLDYFGLAEVEILFQPDSGTAYLVEINARPWLQFGLPHASGQNLLSYALGHERGERTAHPPAAWLYFSSDLYACFASGSGLVRTGALSLGNYFGSCLKATQFAVWDRNDPKPFVHSALSAIARTLRPRRR
jgi:predicted ATP-grasp superfamily ATP-dependent carboligase